MKWVLVVVSALCVALVIAKSVPKELKELQRPRSMTMLPSRSHAEHVTSPLPHSYIDAAALPTCTSLS